jgi:RNA polymerase sigma factor (sigma-70 family)
MSRRMFDSLPTNDVETLPISSSNEPGGVSPIPPTDGERLMRFRRRRDEAAFRELIEAHAPLVWSVCWQVLRHEQDAEDAFQATFLILARRAGSIRETHSIAPWLYRVAFRTALLARRRRLRRVEEPLVDEPLSTDEQLAAVHRREQCLMLLEELHALPARLRAALALCYLEGRSRRAAADELGVTPASVKGLLARGTRLLRSRLMRRGVALSTAMGVVAAHSDAAQAAMNPALVERTAVLGLGFAFHAGGGAGGGLPSGGSAATLAEKGLQAMTIATAAKPAAGLLAVCAASLLAIAGAAGQGAGDDGATGTIAIEAAVATDPLDEVSSDAEFAASATDLVAAPAVEPVAPAVDTLDAPSDYEIVGPAATSEAPAEAFVDDLSIPSDPALAATSVVEPAPATSPILPDFASTPTYPTTPVAAPLSEAAVKLEIEYWERRAAGLSKRAEALRFKAAELNTQLQRRGEALEAEAEAELALADVKLCEANAQRLKDMLAARENPPTSIVPDIAIPTGWAPVPTLPSPSVPAASAVAPAEVAADLYVDASPDTAPPVEPAPEPTIDAMRQQIDQLQAANRLLLERIEHLEAGHGDQRK